jgi:CO/xanthine dehydrogenase FAD-binding subunit
VRHVAVRLSYVRDAEGTEPSADRSASVEYREHLARVLVGRALEAV